jgi:hypothetical protein
MTVHLRWQWRSWVSEEEKELAEFKRMLQALTSEAKDKNDLGIKLLDNLSAQYDDYLARKKLNENQQFQRGICAWIKFITRWFLKLTQRLNYGSPYADPITRNFIQEIGNSGYITDSQIKLLNVYKMIRLDPSGICLVFLPTKAEFLRAKIWVGLLLVLTILGISYVWKVAICISPGFSIAYIFGAILGKLWKAVYDLAWGREKLAKYIHSRYPWYQIVS